MGILVMLSALAVPAAADEAGKQAFMDANCDRCHSIASENITATVKSEKMKGPDLDGVGATHDAAWITEFVKREVKLEGKNHRSPWKGSDAELTAVAEWLATMK